MQSVVCATNSDDKDNQSDTWKGWFEGLSHCGEKSIGGVLRSPDGKVITFSRKTGAGSAREAEYEAVIELLSLAIDSSVKSLVLYGTSSLVVDQLNGAAKQTNVVLPRLHDKAKNLLSCLIEASVVKINEKLNAEARDIAGGRRAGTVTPLPSPLVLVTKIGETILICEEEGMTPCAVDLARWSCTCDRFEKGVSECRHLAAVQSRLNSEKEEIKWKKTA